MREAGIVKWFGGYNPRIHQLMDYGYIIRKNKPDLYFNRSHLRCKVKALSKGTAVSFEVAMNFKNNMEQAFKVKLLKNENLEFIMNLDVFNLLNGQEKFEFLNDFNEQNIIELWGNMKFKLKMLLLFKISCENMDSRIFEKSLETDKFIRAIILVLWAKHNVDKKNMAYENASVLLSFYLKEISEENENLEELVNIFPLDKNYKVDINKEWIKWTVFDFLQNCNNTNIAEDMERGNEQLIKIITCLYEINKQATREHLRVKS